MLVVLTNYSTYIIKTSNIDKFRDQHRCLALGDRIFVGQKAFPWTNQAKLLRVLLLCSHTAGWISVCVVVPNFFHFLSVFEV